MHKVARFILSTLLLMVLVITLHSCIAKEDCDGCYEEAPYSTPDGSYCYPDRDMCTDEMGVECQRCI